MGVKEDEKKWESLPDSEEKVLAAAALEEVRNSISCQTRFLMCVLLIIELGVMHVYFWMVCVSVMNFYLGDRGISFISRVKTIFLGFLGFLLTIPLCRVCCWDIRKSGNRTGELKLGKNKEKNKIIQKRIEKQNSMLCFCIHSNMAELNEVKREVLEVYHQLFSKAKKKAKQENEKSFT